METSFHATLESIQFDSAAFDYFLNQFLKKPNNLLRVLLLILIRHVGMD